MAEKIANLRLFADADGKTNLALADVGGEALVVSQFTLYADTRKGRRPSWTDAADPAVAAERVEAFADGARGARRPGRTRGLRRPHGGRAGERRSVHAGARSTGTSPPVGLVAH